MMVRASPRMDRLRPSTVMILRDNSWCSGIRSLCPYISWNSRRQATL